MSGVMDRTPRKADESILSRPRKIQILWQGAVMTGACLGLYYLVAPLLPGMTPNIDRTMLFAALVLTQLLHSFNFRSETESVWSSRSFANRWLLAGLVGSMALQCLVIYLPAAQSVFKTAALSPVHWLAVIVASVAAIAILDAAKLFTAARSRAASQGTVSMTQHSPLPHEDLAAYAHELRGALTIIAGYTELLRRPLSAAERESALDGIERAIRRADTLCSDALAGRAPASAARAPGPISLAVLAEQVVADLRSATGRTIELTAEGSAMVLGDEDALARVLGNLIDNAAKYSLRNAPIEVRVAEEDVRVRSRGVRRGRGPRTGNPRRRTGARRRALRPAGS